MKAWGAIGLVCLGGFTEALMRGWHDALLWGVLLGASVVGWSWSALFTGATRLWSAVTGRRLPLSASDPQALAAEMAALNAQIAQLRDTATSFDVSFDRTLVCLDERLRRVEQQTAYVPPPSVPLGRS